MDQEQTATVPQGLISKTLAWIRHPINDRSTDLADYFGFLVLVLLAGLLWSKVVKQTLEAV
jgi:hypothetical protein